MKEIKLTDIKNIKIGQAQDATGGSGCTVIMCEKGACASVDIRGGGPASRECALLSPVNMIEKIHAVVISGGSAYGLDASGGVMKYLEEKGIGFDVGVGVVPIVCGSSLFDLVVGDPKCRPDKEMGYSACIDAEKNMEPHQGNFGAGTGATVGKFLGIEYMMKGGIGTYAVEYGDLQIGAIVAVNALGDIIDIETGALLAGLLNENKNGLRKTTDIMYSAYEGRNVFSGNTTIGCIITNAKINKSQANKIATMAHNGFARAINPVHTSADGDSIYTLATGEIEAHQDILGTLAAEVMAKAINNAVLYAESAYGIKSAKDLK